MGAADALTRGGAGSPTRARCSGRRLLTAWQLDAVAVAVLVLVAAGVPDRRGAGRRSRTRGRAGRCARTAAFLAGLAVCAFATNGSIAVYDQVLFTAHMAGHLALVMVAPALLVAGRPLTPRAGRAPARASRADRRIARGRVVSLLTAPPVALASLRRSDRRQPPHRADGHDHAQHLGRPGRAPRLRARRLPVLRPGRRRRADPLAAGVTRPAGYCSRSRWRSTRSPASCSCRARTPSHLLPSGAGRRRVVRHPHRRRDHVVRRRRDHGRDHGRAGASAGCAGRRPRPATEGLARAGPRRDVRRAHRRGRRRDVDDDDAAREAYNEWLARLDRRG